MLIFLAYVSALAAAERLLAVRTGVKAADVIVVLGGDGPHRAARAANLFRHGFAPRIVVSGDGDCLDIRQLMMEAGVPEVAIEVECASRNTFENAEFTAPILTAMGARSALLVTSGFHTRRALGCFRKAAPGVEWMSAPVDADKPIWRLLWDTEGMQIAKEYPKVGWYAWHYGVPWNPEPRMHREARDTIQ